jgi:hypothetical protein
MNYPASACMTLILSLMIAPALFAQNNPPYLLNGYMGVEGGESFHYKLELRDSAGDYLNGYSYTFSDHNDTVKTALTAQKDPIAKTLRIREREIIYNNNFHSRALICLVDALLNLETQQYTLSGPLITRTAGHGAACSKGSITFINKKEIDALFSGAPKPEIAAEQHPANTQPTPPAPLNQNEFHKATPVQNKPPAPSVPEKITAGKDGLYNWSADKVIFRIWDGSNVDNDRVTILLNDRPVLENYTLTKDKKTITFDLAGRELNIISVIALNEGNTPPNTANINISDGKKNYDIIAYNKITKTATIRIRKKQ